MEGHKPHRRLLQSGRFSPSSIPCKLLCTGRRELITIVAFGCLYCICSTTRRMPRTTISFLHPCKMRSFMPMLIHHTFGVRSAGISPSINLSSRFEAFQELPTKLYVRMAIHISVKNNIRIYSRCLLKYQEQFHRIHLPSLLKISCQTLP